MMAKGVSVLGVFAVFAALAANAAGERLTMRALRLDQVQNPERFPKPKGGSPKFDIGKPSPNYAGVVAHGSMGKTNPHQPKMNTPINQKSHARLASVNSAEDWCTFGPPGGDEELGDIEQKTVAWCTKPRNNARVIPDGTVTAVHFVKTPLYVQVMARGDFTKIGFKSGDTGGELDPHGATGKGNPVGGNVTSNVSGKDVHYQEWMNYIGHNIMCFRVCTAGSDKAPPQKECEHEFDEVGCPWIMPGDYTNNKFDTCEADAAYPPGLYVTGGSTSSFQQYDTGLYTANGKTLSYSNGKKGEKTPSAAQSMPKSSHCSQGSSIRNGIKSIVPKGHKSHKGSKGHKDHKGHGSHSH